MAGVPLRVTFCSLPLGGVFFTVNGSVVSDAAAPRSSLKVSVSVAPFTRAADSVGAVVSTLWAAS